MAAWLVLFAALAVVVIGSLAEINAQSAGYRRSIDAGYVQLASVVADSSNRTGAQLASVVDSAAQLANGPVPETARAQIQQGLDAAVQATSQQAAQAASLAPPVPTGTISQRFTEVMEERAFATSALRSLIDRQLGMTPLPVAGAPSTTESSPSPPISLSAASGAMGQVGQRYVAADATFRSVVASLRRQGIPDQLPASVWVPSPSSDAPLSPVRLDALATSLSGPSMSVPLVAFHQLIISTVGLSPAAVTTGASGVIADGCRAPASTDPSPSPTVLPPTSSVTASVAVTNCGTVTETGVKVTQTVTLADPPGTPLPPADDRGSRAEATVTVRSGSSVAPGFPAVSVDAGHLYNLVVAIDIPTGQEDSAGSSQSFLLQIAS